MGEKGTSRQNSPPPKVKSKIEEVIHAKHAYFFQLNIKASWTAGSDFNATH